jgi:hypothetical protein
MVNLIMRIFYKFAFLRAVSRRAVMMVIMTAVTGAVQSARKKRATNVTSHQSQASAHGCVVMDREWEVKPVMMVISILEMDAAVPARLREGTLA